MNKYYVTYSWGSMQRNNYSTIEAEDQISANIEVHKRIGDSWAFLYNEQDKEMAIDRFDLTEIPLQPQQPRNDE